MSLEADNMLTGCSLNKEPKYLGYIDGTIVASDGMPAKPKPIDILIHKEKAEYKARKQQIAINLLGLEGGRPYVNHRLSRFAAETQIDWIGGKRADGSCATGRLQQTHAFPYLGRIAQKFNQYVFSDEPTREGGDEDVIKDITRDGQSVNDVMRQVSDYRLAAQHCWIGIDAPAPNKDGTTPSVKDKQDNKIRPYWQVYSPLDVIDWKYDDQGKLLWAKTRGVEIDDSDPAQLPVVTKVIKIWKRGEINVIRITKSKDGRKKDVITEETIYPTLKDRVPLIECGRLTGKPIPFDDLESINRTIMDLGSVDRANYYKTNYPQMVLPASMIQTAVQNGYATNATEAVTMVVGYGYPIFRASNEDPEPKYLMPDASALAATGDRITTLKREMFEVTGLALESDSRQVASAEAKAWDFLDVAALMKSRAEDLEDIEKKCVELMVAWDSTIKPWTPVYNRSFDVGNFKEEMEALVLYNNMPQPDEARKIGQKLAFDRILRLGSSVTEEEKETVYKAIDDYKAPEGVPMTDVLGMDAP